MSKVLLVSLCDTRANLFYAPFPARNELEALRMFGEALKQRDGLASQYPADFSLYVVGEWSNDEGYVVGTDLRLLTRGDALLRQIGMDMKAAAADQLNLIPELSDADR